MKKVLGVSLIVLLAGAMVLSAGGAKEGPAAAKPAVKEAKLIKLSHVGSLEDARHKAALKFKEIVDQRTNGEVTVQVFPSGQIGGDRDAIEGVKLGTIQMTVAGAGIFGNYEPKMGITALPFLFENFEQAWAFNDSPVNKEVCKLLENQNIMVLAFWENGFRCLTNSVKPVKSAQDVKGFKIRTPENPTILATMKALGANPSPLPWPEVYMALQQKAFDGQENPIPIIYSGKLYEVQKYLTITNHVYEPMPLVIGKNFFNGLTPQQQEVIRAAAEETKNFNRQLIKTQTDQMLKELEKAGMIVIQPEINSFKEATKDVPKQFVATFGEKLINDAYNFTKK